MKRVPSVYVSGTDEIKGGKVTDIYFQRTKSILEKSESSDVHVAAEIHSYGFSRGYDWAVFTGLEEVLWLLEGLPLDVFAMDEGTLFRAMEPVARLEGRYIDFAVYETSILGMLRHSTSVSTKAARIKLSANGRPVLFFGIRSVHPAIAPMVDRAAFLGGCDAVSGVSGASMMGLDPMGTMPHALILVVGDEVKAWRLFHETMPENVPRIALVDTFYDERVESLRAADALGKNLFGVRLDTPGSRRGNMRRIVEETRWALNIKGYSDVKIFVSGGLSEDEIRELVDVADGFGVGTSIAFPESVDLALDIVERNGQPLSKRGKLPGRKQVFRCEKMHDVLTIWGKNISRCPVCDGPVEPLIKPVIQNGEIVAEIPSAKEIRERVLSQLDRIQRAEQFSPTPTLSP